MNAADAQTVLDQDRHARLIEDIDNVCRIAGIPKSALYSSATEVCGKTELDWLRNFRLRQAHGEGLLMHGTEHTTSPEQKMIAMAAAFLRNFIDARVMSVNTVLETLEAGRAIDCTVLLVPNFYIDLHGGRQLPAYKAQALYDMLLARASAGKMNVLYVSSRKSMREQYGQPFFDHLESYEKSEGN